MKIIALEEHFATPEIMEAWLKLPPDLQDLSVKPSSTGDIQRRLYDLADERIRLMDDSGVDLQVLSLTTPGMQSVEVEQSIALSRASNDLIAATVRSRPDRFQGLATLPTPDPASAALELKRAITELNLNGALLCGRTRDRNLDHPDLLPIFETAAALDAPLYLHPQSPVVAVRNAYYSGFGDTLDALFASGGLGWHYEAGIQVLRLVLAGTFDLYPNLQVILGHWGEVILFFLDRIDNLSSLAAQSTKLRRPISDYFLSNVSVTPSGIFSQRYFRWAREVLGSERVMFSTDYPYHVASDGAARRFLQDADLSDSERDAVAHGNWKKMTAAIKRS